MNLSLKTFLCQSLVIMADLDISRMHTQLEVLSLYELYCYFLYDTDHNFRPLSASSKNKFFSD